MWDERYGQPGYVYGTEPNDFLVEVAERIPAGPVLSLAEGEGRNAVFLASRGHDVLGVDSSRVGLQKAQALARERGVAVRTELADLAEYAIEPGAWAGIVSIFCHLPPAVRARVHAAAVAGLRPGGAFVLEAYRKEQLGRGTGGPPVLELLYDLDEVRAELAGLELVHAEALVRDVREGGYHSGEGAVIQIVGIKPA